jgi:hypothetical protein
MEENVTQENSSTEKNKEPNGNQGPELNISDLIALKNIVDVASQRGAFKAAELEGVGKVYNKLNNFLESVTKKEA